MKIKKFLVGAFAVLAALSLSACSGNKKSSSSTNEPKELNVEFVPSTQANKMEAKAKPLGTLLQKQLHIPVHVTVSTDFSGLVEAMSSKKVDVGFMPPYSYMLAHKRGIADVLLQAERYGYDEPSGKMNHKLMHKYRGMIVVKKGSKIKSWKDLKGKKIAIGDPTSSSGYVYPIAELYKKGLNVTKESKLVNITSDDQKVISVLNGDVDAAFVFSDARNIAAKDDKRAMTDVVPIYFTQWIPNDTISVRKDMPKKFRVKLAKAFKNIAKSKKGKQIIESIYSHYGYVDAKDSDFDGLRNYQKIVNEATGK
ncbi:putative alkylphosphonate ABC transporter [Lactobacillus helveticus]|uniref:Putative alkylphosphonate ABC transporter n=1 Tax=Lactobacillus helveticus TaxID=1587 RepID=A0A386RBB2_LACHE|nr:phosphate/phosphite/phosphonate ABC transporter substrate-binding protein [Lactobacillus helveticus]AYE60588.1 putative alkylphosphonate ABC transporter [Lactobacillus helveticus]MCD9225569.1 phosphate/phosphite/phosphonate ABC transporter substrate-binding protein [Lactobacillus helveticus]